jgi:hypothetical protein
MNKIFTLLLILATFPFMQFPADVDQSKENLSISIKDLRNAPTEIVLDGRSLSLSAFPWRDFMPGTLNGPDGSPMMVALKVATTDKKPFPSGVRMDRAWVLFGEQVWETSKVRDQLNSPPYEKDSWIACSDSPACETTLRDGPKWGPNVFVDVVVRLTDKEGQHHLLQVRKQCVTATQ